MLIKELNNKTKKEIQQLKDVETPLRLLFSEKPNLEKLEVFNDFVLKHREDVTLVLSSREENWISLSDFQSINNKVRGIEFHTINVNPKFENIDGIESFKKLKNITFLYNYSNKVDLEKLTSCPKLEYIHMENSLTKKHHIALNKIKGLRKLYIKGLDVSLLEEMPDLEDLFVFGLKNGEGLGSKMPNLKQLRIFMSNSLKSLDFLSEVKKLDCIVLDGISQIKKLPNLDELDNLEIFSVMNMKRLESFPKLNSGLKDLRIGYNVPALETEKLKHINSKNLPNLESIEINLKTVGESDIILKQLEK